MRRISKENYYLDIAETVLERATCLRRVYGAIIVTNDEIIATGYNGAPRGRKNCTDLGFCSREALNVPRGERYELCRSVHAEANAIISASRRDCVGGTLYLVGRDARTGELLTDATSCAMCRRQVINAGLKYVVIRKTPTDFQVVDVEKEWVEEDDSLQEEPVLTDADLVLGIRPEFLDIADSSALEGEIYGAMPTGMESTIKVRVGEFLLTGVIFGSSLFTIGTKVPLSVTGSQIMLFDRRSGKCITSGSLRF